MLEIKGGVSETLDIEDLVQLTDATLRSVYAALGVTRG